MARVVRISKGKTAIEIELKAIRMLWNRYQSLVSSRLKGLIEAQSLPQWDDVTSEAGLKTMLQTIAAKSSWDDGDLEKIGGLAALLENFIEIPD